MGPRILIALCRFGVAARRRIPASTPDRFARLLRYLNRQAPDPDFPYEGMRLKPGVDRYAYRDTSQDALLQPFAPLLPLRRAAYPDLKDFLAGTRERESAALIHLYYHYPDHVELAPDIARFAMSQEVNLRRDAMGGLILISVYNYLPEAIARLEVNGQALDPGSYALPPVAPLPAGCRDIPMPMGGAFLDLSRPLALR